MGNNNIKLSICILTYNRLEYLKPTVNHLFKELEGLPINYEVIIRDGGSDDGTVEYLINDNRIAYSPGGLKGDHKEYYELFKEAQGKYIFTSTDKLMVKLTPIMKGVAIMDNDPEFAALCHKMAVFKAKFPIKLHPSMIDENHILEGDICLFRRHDALKYWDLNYTKSAGIRDFHTMLMLMGGIIALPKEISSFEIKLRHYNYQQFEFRWRKNKINEDQLRYKNKYAIVFRMIESYYSSNKILRIRVSLFSKMLRQYHRISSSRFSWFISRRIQKKFPNICSLEPFPCIPNEELPPDLGPAIPGIYPDDAATMFKKFLNPYIKHKQKNYDDVQEYLRHNHEFLKTMSKKKEWESIFVEQKLDQRIKLPYMMEIYTWLLKGACAYSINNYRYEKDLYVIQKLPKPVVRLAKAEIRKLTQA